MNFTSFSHLIFSLRIGPVLEGACFQVIQLVASTFFQKLRFPWASFPVTSPLVWSGLAQQSLSTSCLVCRLWGWRQSLWLSVLIPEVQQIFYTWLMYFSGLVGLIYGAH